MNKTYATIDEIKESNGDYGRFFFEASAMSFFGSVVESGVIKGNMFVTSEQDGMHPRLFTVRYAESDGTILTVGEFQQFDTLLEAVNAAEKVEHCANCGEPTFEDVMAVVNVEPASYGMRDPYPGYDGDLCCMDCVGGDS